MKAQLFWFYSTFCKPISKLSNIFKRLILRHQGVPRDDDLKVRRFSILSSVSGGTSAEETTPQPYDKVISVARFNGKLEIHFSWVQICHESTNHSGFGLDLSTVWAKFDHFLKSGTNGDCFVTSFETHFSFKMGVKFEWIPNESQAGLMNPTSYNSFHLFRVDFGQFAFKLLSSTNVDLNGGLWPKDKPGKLIQRELRVRRLSITGATFVAEERYSFVAFQIICCWTLGCNLQSASIAFQLR